MSIFAINSKAAITISHKNFRKIQSSPGFEPGTFVSQAQCSSNVPFDIQLLTVADREFITPHVGLWSNSDAIWRIASEHRPIAWFLGAF